MSHDSHTRRTEFLAGWRKQTKAAARSIARGWLQGRYFANRTAILRLTWPRAFMGTEDLVERIRSAAKAKRCREQKRNWK